jgi:hypothetical protein
MDFFKENLREVLYKRPSVAMEIARSYNILAPLQELRNLVGGVYDSVDCSLYSKFELHSLVNAIVMNNYCGESYIKSCLVERFIKEDVVAAFEIKANSSRLDFLRINGDTISYEIKSEYDSLKKLEKQVNNYEELFEYNYIVIDKKHLKKAIQLIPKNYGILIVDGDLKEIKKAKKNSLINCQKQLNLFTKKELYTHFGESKAEVLQKFTCPAINKQFKSMLKKRYLNKWNFLRDNKANILPIDYQFFFRHNISPKLLYL